MSGGLKGAKRPLERPLDGGVRPREHALDAMPEVGYLRFNSALCRIAFFVEASCTRFVRKPYGLSSSSSLGLSCGRGLNQGVTRMSFELSRFIASARWVFRKSVTGHFGIVTDDFGNVTGHFGDMTDRLSAVF